MRPGVHNQLRLAWEGSNKASKFPGAHSQLWTAHHGISNLLGAGPIRRSIVEIKRPQEINPVPVDGHWGWTLSARQYRLAEMK